VEQLKSSAGLSMIVRVTDANAFESYFDSVAGIFPRVTLSNESFDEVLVYRVHVPNLMTAKNVQNLLGAQESVVAVSNYRGLDQHLAQIAAERFDRPSAHRSSNQAGIGIRPYINHNDGPQFGGSGDPQYSNQWHLVNGGGGPLALDNNVTPAIFDTLGFDGSGIVVGFPAIGLNEHIDFDHLDLVNGYNPALSQIVDANLLADNAVITGWAGIVGAERDNGIGGQGVAPGAQTASFRWDTDLDLVEFEAYDWKTQDVDVKFFYNNRDYVRPQGRYNNGAVSDYVMDPLANSIRFGRKNKGVVNIFGTGTKFSNGLTTDNFLPDPYNFPPAPGDVFSPVDEWANRTNIVADGLTNTFVNLTPVTDRGYYVTGNTNFYPPATDRRSLVIASVAEDGNYDIYAAQGTNVFASVYAGTNNEDQSLPGTSLRGVLTTTPGVSGNTAEQPTSATDAVVSATTTGPAVAAGIVALMLDANPKLTVRDIQHILFESIQDSTKDPSVKWPNFDATRTYYIPDASALSRSFWQSNSGLYNSDTVTNQAIRHSDNYGFGIIDAELAVQKAMTWAGSPKLTLLDTGVKGEDLPNGTADLRIPQDIESPEWVELIPVDGSTGQSGASTFVPGTPAVMNFCVRQNISVESVVVELSITGEGSNDLLIELFSPSGTRSILALPTTVNPFGTADADVAVDDEFDLRYGSGIYNGDTYAYFQHPFLSWKHWGEKAGGVWTVQITDYGVDAETPVGAEQGDDPLTQPGADMFTGLGEIGVPGSQYRSEKTLTGFRFKIYGTDTGLPIFEGCDPFTTNCPADLNGDGKIDALDLQIYINMWIQSDALADLDGDGDVDYTDLQIYRGIWQPGFCEGESPFVGGRPRPGTGGSGSDNDPIVNPI
ncbi:MAG: proprotein convertase P-domain-containing protein, partial [Phycisphaerales bacterium]